MLAKNTSVCSALEEQNVQRIVVFPRSDKNCCARLTTGVFDLPSLKPFYAWKIKGGPQKEIWALPIIDFQGVANWREAKPNHTKPKPNCGLVAPNKKKTKPIPATASMREQVKDIRRMTTCTTISSIGFSTRSNVTTTQLRFWTTENALSGNTKSRIQGTCRSEGPATAALTWWEKGPPVSWLFFGSGFLEVFFFGGKNYSGSNWMIQQRVKSHIRSS